MPEIAIDWLSFKQSEFLRKKYIDFKQFLIDLVAKNGYTFEPCKGVNGYDQGYISHAGFAIFCDYDAGEDIEHILVQVHGTGCSFIEEFYEGGIYAFIKLVVDCECTITRLDLASDDKQGILKLKTIENKYHTGMWKGSAQTMSICGAKDKNGQFAKGVTFYIGSRRSNAFVRIYDKAKQTDTEGHWVRCELELKKQYAIDVVTLILQNDRDKIADIYRALIYDRIKFLSKKDENRNYQYNKVCTWWNRFLDGCKVGIKLARKHDFSVQKTSKWVIDKCAPSIAVYASAYGMDSITDLINDGQSRFSKQHMIMLKEFDAEQKQLAFEKLQKSGEGKLIKELNTRVKEIFGSGLDHVNFIEQEYFEALFAELADQHASTELL